MTSRLIFLVAICAALPIAPAFAEDAGVTGQQLIGGWIETVRSWSRVLAFIAGAGGIILAAVSIFDAYKAQDDSSRMRHMGAAMFAGVLTIIFVVIGWVSNVLIPA